MKKRNLSKSRFLIYYQTKKNKPIMGKGTFMSKPDKYHILHKKITLTAKHKRLALCKSVTNLL